jgi:hypothetical protein
MSNAPTPEEIREAYSDYDDEWTPIKEEAHVDMRYVSGDPWDPADRAQREDAGRPCISLDELNQYLNQYNNTLRQNKRAIQVIPKGSGADDKDATRRENLIRGIENESNAQEAYVTMAENAASRSYGYLLLRTEFRGDWKDSDDPDQSMFEQKIVIQRVANPDTILLNPGYQKADASDVEDGFVVKRIRKSDFGRKYPHADKQSFSSQDMKDAKDWIGEKDLQIAEYWKVHKKPKKLLLLKSPTGPLALWADEIDRKPDKSEVIKERTVEIKNVVEYVTNGIEILEEIPWAGSRIPIISCFGKELWVDEGSGAKRKLLSMIRLARDPQMLFAYMCTQEAEEAGMTPKAPFMGAKGQFESARETWEMINKQPFSFVEYDIVLDSATQQALPPPSRPQWTPNFEVYELAKDSIRRSIQAAMGITPLPTAAQRDSEKSGVALERISTQESIGSFHFTDNFDRALQNLGWQVNELISEIYDTQRELPIEKADGTYATLHAVGNTSHPIGDDGAYDVQGIPQQENSPEPVEHLHTGKGEFDVTISTGPSYQSQREQASEFVDHLIENWQQLGIPEPIANKILALGIKLKDIGPIGDAIQELLNPPDPNNMPPQAQAAISQLQAQLQKLQEENAALHADRAAKVVEQQTKIQVASMRSKDVLDKNTMDFITQVIKAELAAKSKADATVAQNDAQRELAMLGFGHDATLHASGQAHEVAQSAVDHGRNMELAQQQATNQQVQQASDQVHQQTMAQQQPPAGSD